MANNRITYYKTDPLYGNEKFMSHAVGKSELFTRDVKKTIGLTGKEIDGNFLTLEGRDVYDFRFDDKKNLVITTLNGDKYAVSLEDSIRQSDWNESDAESMSYIRNKPLKVSDFENDAGYTKTLYYPLINPDENEKENYYEIGVITVNGEQMPIFGKLASQNRIIQVEAVYDESIKNYRLDIDDGSFEHLCRKDYLLMPELGSDGKAAMIVITAGHEVSFYTDSQNIADNSKVKYLDIITDEYSESDVYVAIAPETPVWISCSTDDDDAKYVYIMPMVFMAKDKEPEKARITVENDIDEGVVVIASGFSSELANETCIDGGRTTELLYDTTKTVYLGSFAPDKTTKIQCNWKVSYSTGTTKTYEGKESISFAAEADATVELLSVYVK